MNKSSESTHRSTHPSAKENLRQSTFHHEENYFFSHHGSTTLARKAREPMNSPARHVKCRDAITRDTCTRWPGQGRAPDTRGR